MITWTTEAWPEFRVLRMLGIEGRKVGLALRDGRLAARIATERRGRKSGGNSSLESPHGGSDRVGTKMTDAIARERNSHLQPLWQLTRMMS